MYMSVLVLLLCTLTSSGVFNVFSIFLSFFCLIFKVTLPAIIINLAMEFAILPFPLNYRIFTLPPPHPMRFLILRFALISSINFLLKNAHQRPVNLVLAHLFDLLLPLLSDPLDLFSEVKHFLNKFFFFCLIPGRFRLTFWYFLLPVRFLVHLLFFCFFELNPNLGLNFLILTLFASKTILPFMGVDLEVVLISHELEEFPSFWELFFKLAIMVNHLFESLGGSEILDLHFHINAI